MKKRIQLY